MRLLLLPSAAAAVIGGALLLTADTAGAQTRKRQQDDMFFYTNAQRDYRHRPRTRVVVRSRSYLDPGPELLPGEYKYRQYAEPYGYSAMDNVNPNLTWNRNPFNGPFDTPGGRPWPGQVDWW
ncbi:hypothetical protein [Pseudorhodoplanes sp.]|uniref:hypothetical protein n=1 Tax=Pseudorhodoplanes sp. TaxID=1934341 RepID=UPI002B91EB72|nr:hypothetical protein [Pseudorhodoplanes sp.]HWV40863.1 hypothetical protein [Pseudorhodoplanes sp.]